MAFYVYDAGYGTYTYDTSTGRVGRGTTVTNEDAARYEAEMKEAQERMGDSNSSEPPEHLKALLEGKPITINVQSLYDMQKQKTNFREMGQTNIIAEMYELAGLGEPPKSSADFTETDRAYLNLVGRTQNDHCNVLVGMSTLNEGGDLFISALTYAFDREALRYAYSDETIGNRIEEMDLPDSVDTELLFNAAKAYGEKWMNMQDDNFEAQINRCQRQDAVTIYKAFDPSYKTNPETLKNVDALSESIGAMIREAADIAAKYIKEGYTGNIYDKIKEESSFRLEVNGKSYTWNDVMNKLTQSGVYTPNPGDNRATLGQSQEAIAKYEEHFAFVY